MDVHPIRCRHREAIGHADASITRGGGMGVGIDDPQLGQIDDLAELKGEGTV